MSKATIRFATDILRRLGEELNPSADQGILELVKNSYDADAIECSVRLDGVASVGGTIEVSDNGDGMDLEEILDGWFVLGRSRKVTSSITRRNRVPAGNKGLGRLAAMRLGDSVQLVTRPRNSDSEYAVTINWADYEDVDLVHDVEVPILKRAQSKKESGTDIIIRGLRRPVGRMDVKRLARALILLADPFDDDPNAFRAVLRTQEFLDLEKLVEKRYFEHAEYHLIAELKNGLSRARVTDWRGKTLFEAKHDEIAGNRNKGAYRSPDTTFDLWVFILTRQSFSGRSISLGEVKSWIENFGGVHLYLNGIRVTPYGNAGSDWLDMNLRRVRSPEERPGTNTSIGRVSVLDTRESLAQKTDRSGFIENESFEDLRAFAQDALEWMARRRVAAAEARRQRERTTSPTRADRSRKSLQEQIDKAPAELKENLSSALVRYDREKQRETDALRREVQLYRTLSTAGITAATFAHESSGNPLKIIGQSVRSLERRGQRELGDRYATTLKDPVDSIRHACDSLGVLSSATLRLIEADKRRLGRIDLHQVIRQVLTTFEPFLMGRDVTLVEDLAPGEPYLRGTEAAVESIVTNFLNNSLAALEAGGATDRKILVRTRIVENTWELSVADSGPGIVDISIREIWLPGETRRANGTGLGLTIVRDAVADLGGKVDAVAQGVLGGASFTVELPILGSVIDGS